MREVVFRRPSFDRLTMHVNADVQPYIQIGSTSKNLLHHQITIELMAAVVLLLALTACLAPLNVVAMDPSLGAVRGVAGRALGRRRSKGRPID
jgi:hypothetical protein